MRWQQFNALTKPRVIQLIVFCALIGMVLAVGRHEVRFMRASMAFSTMQLKAAAAPETNQIPKHAMAPN